MGKMRNGKILQLMSPTSQEVINCLASVREDLLVKVDCQGCQPNAARGQLVQGPAFQALALGDDAELLESGDKSEIRVLPRNAALEELQGAEIESLRGQGGEEEVFPHQIGPLEAKSPQLARTGFAGWAHRGGRGGRDACPCCFFPRNGSWLKERIKIYF